MHMPEAKQQVLMEKIYEEILTMKKELSEIKSALISESFPEKDEHDALRVMEHECREGKYRAWKDVKKDLEND